MWEAKTPKNQAKTHTGGWQITLMLFNRKCGDAIDVIEFSKRDTPDLPIQPIG